MDPYLAIGQSIAGGIEKWKDRRYQQKMMEDEYAQRLRLLNEKQRLEDEAPTAEMKLLRMFQANPQAFTQFRQALDPLGMQELALRQQQFQQQAQNQNYGNQMEYWKAQRQNWQDQYGTGSPTSRQRDFQFLMQMPGMTQEKALQYLFRPDLMSQMMMMGGMGGIGGGLPGGGGLNYGQ